MLLREGVNRGATLTVPVVEFATGTKRHPSDILPYLPAFAPLFSPLPPISPSSPLKLRIVPLSDIECLTQTVSRIQQPMKAMGNRQGKLFDRRSELVMEVRLTITQRLSNLPKTN